MVVTIFGAVPLKRIAAYLCGPVIDRVFVECDQFAVFEVSKIGIENGATIIGLDDGRVDELT